MCTILQHVDHFLVCNSKTKSLSFLLVNSVVDILVPDIVAQTIHLFLVEIITILHLQEFLIFSDKSQIILIVNFFSIDHTCGITIHLGMTLTSAKAILCNKANETQAQYCDKAWSPASDFSNCCHCFFVIFVLVF